jgi:hypothetical protein
VVEVADEQHGQYAIDETADASGHQETACIGVGRLRQEV